MKSYERAWLENNIPWKLIDTAPKDKTKIVLYNGKWDSYPIAYWDWVEGPEEDGTGGYCLWHIVDESWTTANGDGLLWPEEDFMPTHWQPTPELFPDIAESITQATARKDS